MIQFKFTSPDHIDKLPLDDIIFLDNLIFTGVDVVIGYEEITAEDIQVYSSYGSLVVNTRSATNVEVYSLTGTMVYTGICSNHLSVDLSRGIYIVRAGSKTVKCFVSE